MDPDRKVWEKFHMFQRAGNPAGAHTEEEEKQMEAIYDLSCDDGLSAAYGFITAAATGHFRHVQRLLHLGINVNVIYSGKTAISEATLHGHSKCVEILLNAGADMHLAISGQTPLMTALSNNRDECVNVLMSKREVVQNDRDKVGRTTLMYAALGGYKFVVQELLRTVPDVQREFMTRDSLGETVLTYAAMGGHVDLIRDVILPKYQFQGEFVQAVAYGDPKQLRILLESEINIEFLVNTTEEMGISPLALSVVLDDLACTLLLLDFCASPDALDSNGRHALIYAAACGSYRCLEVLISAKSTLCWKDKRSRNALMMACRNGHTDCASLLIRAIREEEEVEKRYAAIQGWTTSSNPTSIVVVTGERGYQAIKIFLQNVDTPVRIPSWMRDERSDWTLPRILTKDLNISDQFGMSTLAYASRHNRLDCVKLLLKAGVDSNYSSENAHHPLILAAREGHFEVVIQFLKYLTRGNQTDRHIFEALVQAVSGNQLMIVQFLLSHAMARKWRSALYEEILCHAARTGHLECLSHIFSLCCQRFPVDANRLLICAAGYGHNLCLRFLLNNGAEFNDHLAYVAAYRASQCGHLSTVKMLVREERARLNPICLSEGSLINATCISGAPALLLSFLISHGAVIDTDYMRNTMTPLMITCMKGQDHLVNVLLEEGAKIMRQDKFGNTALVHAAIGNSWKCIEKILDYEFKKWGLKHPEWDIGRAMQQAVMRENLLSTTALMERSRFNWNWYHRFEAKAFMLTCLLNLSIPPGFLQIHRERFSPLKRALDMLDFSTVRFLLINFYLTEDDFRLLPREGRMRDKMLVKEFPGLPRRDKLLVDAIFKKPWPLSTLSLLTVSATLTASKSPLPRSEAVELLPIPKQFKRQLAFTEPIAKLCTTQWSAMSQTPWYPTCEDGMMKPSTRTGVWAKYLTPCKIHQCVCQGYRLMLNYRFERRRF